MLTKRRDPHRSAGFTLIEVVIVMTILALTLALGAGSYQTWIASTAVRNGAEALISGLQLARAEALGRNVPVFFVKDATGSGWCVGLESACTTKLHVRSGGDGSSHVAVAYLNGASQVMQFDSFGRLQSPTPGAGLFVSFDITHENITDARKLRVTVDVGGNSRMCDPNVSAVGDPRKCP